MQYIFPINDDTTHDRCAECGKWAREGSSGILLPYLVVTTDRHGYLDSSKREDICEGCAAGMKELQLYVANKQAPWAQNNATLFARPDKSTKSVRTPRKRSQQSAGRKLAQIIVSNFHSWKGKK